MATNRDLLKEAIADAKSVKEVAIANAKLALEEAFTPFLKDQLSAKLQEMDKDEDDVKEEVEEVEEEMAKSKKKEDEIIKEEEIDLDELLAELENSKVDEAKKDDDKKDIKEDERTDAEEEGYEDGEKDADEDMDEDEDVDLEDMSEEDLKKFIEDVIEDMVGAGELEAGESFEDDVDVDVDEDGELEVEDDMDTAVDVELDEAKEEIEEKQGYDARLDDAEGAKHGKKKQDMKQRRADSENAEKADGKRKFAGDSKMKEELGEALAAINELKAELNEVNLLNAKLLYTNKIFKAKNLNESKKVKVLKAFDKAKSVEQAKTIFETLSEGITSSVNTPTINESIKRGAASKASGLVPKANVQPIIESNDVYNRMRKLAGLL